MADPIAPNATGNATKAALLEAAKRLVAERGYAGTSVRDLAAASGANLAAVNYHFGSKEALLNEALQDSFLDWSNRIAQAAGSEPDTGSLAQMLACMRVLLDELAENQSLFAAFLEGLMQARRSPELRGQLAAHYAEQRRWVGEIVTAGPDDREIPPRMVEVISSLVLAVTDGLLLQSLLDPDTVPTGDELSALAKGLAATTAKSRRTRAKSPTPGKRRADNSQPSQPSTARERTSKNTKAKEPQ